MCPFTINLYHGKKFIENKGYWSYVGGILGYLDIDKCSYSELEKYVRKGLAYPSIKRIAYLKTGMSFSEGLTFFF